MDYRNFTVEEFASDDRFINWVTGNCSEEEKTFWQLLVLSTPDLQEKIDKATTLVINVGKAQERIGPVKPHRVREIWDNVLATMDEDEVDAAQTKPVIKQKQINISWYIQIAAASCIGVLVLVYFLLRPENENLPEWYSYHNEVPGFIEVENTSGEVHQLDMVDGTVISLEPHSRIKYKTDYRADSMRKVYLEGEAFFDVARNPKKPFVVFTNDIATEVLGTSFRVKSEINKNVVVAVKTGKVSVFSVSHQDEHLAQPKEGVVLLPNQQVVYSDVKKAFEKNLITTPELLETRQSDTRFVFDNTPIESVFGTLEEAYGIEIVFDRETMKNCFLTVPLGSEPLFQKLKVICRTIGASYEIIDARVVVSSAGCKSVNYDEVKSTETME